MRYWLEKFKMCLGDGIEKVWHKASSNSMLVPFTTLGAVWRGLDKSGFTILDVGCGEGGQVANINKRGDFTAVGVDAFAPELRKCKAKGSHHECLLCDVRNLPFRRKSFDIVLALQVIEHLEKEEGRKFIQALEEIARKQVVITTPVGLYRQKDINKHPNPYQKHRAVWFPTEFKSLGYKVRGGAVPKLCDEKGLLARLPGIFRPLEALVWILAGPFVYFLPRLAAFQICFKKLR